MSAVTRARISKALTRTACIHGHPFTPENVYTDPQGGRHCRRCGRDRQRVYERAKAAKKRGIKDDCTTCWEDLPQGECPQSQRACGHHCNHSWNQEICCWCGKVFDEQK